MQSVDIVRESRIERTPRVMQFEGLFDIPIEKRSVERWSVKMPLDEKPWSIGLIVGPSGCGKSTILNELFDGDSTECSTWNNSAVVDNFPEDMPVKDISKILCSVGFSSPPSWLKPFSVLSNGEKFRVSVARALAESSELCVIDEFTSVVDRTVAKIGSHAVAKTVRKSGKKLVAASCHFDVIDWLQPDWIYNPAENEFRWRLVQPRPRIKLKIYRVGTSAWKIFKKHHYLSANISKSARCFVAEIENQPAAFFSYIHLMNRTLKRTKKAHRVVVLPDFQGIGIGGKLSEMFAAGLKNLGLDFVFQSSHPQVIGYMEKSKKWDCIRNRKITKNEGGRGLRQKNLFRPMSSFRYVGPNENLKELLLDWN